MILSPVTSSDVPAIASLHAESWRNAYRGLLPDEYLDHQVVQERRAFWNERFGASAPERSFFLKATEETLLLGFVCVLLDEEPARGARVANLHVSSAYKGKGVGYALFREARLWVARMTPGEPMYLWCVERNHTARRFYERQGGTVVESAVRPVVKGLSVPEVRYRWEPLPA